jgi:ParB family chromosome partitioning protein
MTTTIEDTDRNTQGLVLGFSELGDGNGRRAAEIAREIGGDADERLIKTPREKLRGRKVHVEACEIEVDRIVPDPNQPRNEFDHEAEDQMVASFRSVGQITPIQVRWSDEDGVYILITGERRWRAAKKAGLASLKCVAIEGYVTPDKLIEMQLMENACRKDLTFEEQGAAFKTLMEARSLTQRDLAGMLRIDQANIAHAVALLNLPAPIMAAVEVGKIVPSTAYEISKAGDEETKLEIARDVIENGTSRAKVREKVAANKSKPKTRSRLGKRWSYSTPGESIKITVDRNKALEKDVIIDALRLALGAAEKGWGM